MTDDRRAPRGLAALMTALIDYAGLFPPAALPMADAAAGYRRYRGTSDAWMLGRFVVPASRLDELERAMTALSDGRPGPAAAWPLAALASLPPSDDVDRIVKFNADHGAPGGSWLATIDSIELKAASPGEIEAACASAPVGLDLYFEVAGEAGIDEMCRAAGAAGQALKIRTGGTTVQAFPPSVVVARVLAACATARVPFKATAGLHHPVRAAHRVTYEREAPSATMHGFLNVFVAASLLLSGKANATVATQVLEDEIPGSFRFDDEGLAWRDLTLSVAEIAAARRFARSFGSCSFEEPVTDLAHL